MKRLIQSTLLLAASALATTGCITEPFNEQAFGSPAATVKFSGFAQSSGATVIVEGRRKNDGAWMEITRATATLSVTYGGRTLYYWNAYDPIYDSSEPQTACIFSSSCSINGGGTTVQVRAREEGGDLSALVSFDEGGIDCVQDKVDAGTDWFAAGWDCRGSTTPILNLRYIF